MVQPSDADRRFNALKEAARHNHGDSAIAVRAGLVAMEARREAEAIPLLERCFHGGSGEPRVPHMLGLLHRARGDLAEAIAWLDVAIGLAPDVPLITHARAVAALEAGLPSLAWFDKAIELAPNDAGIFLGRAAALIADDSVDAADAWLDGILLRHPGWIDGQAALVRLRFARRRADAQAALDRALAGAPRDPRLHHLKIMSLMRAGMQEARSAAVDACSALGETPRVLADMAIVSSEQGNLDDADVAFARLDPLVEPELALNWMRHLLRRREPERVAALFGRMEGPVLDAAWPYLSVAWRLTGDPRADWLDRDAFVRIVDFKDDWPVVGQLAALLPSLHRFRSEPLDQSVRGGSQTDGPLLSRVDPAIRALRIALEAEVDRYIAALPPPEPGHPLLGRIPDRPRFAGSWSVRLTSSGFHTPHIHNMGWLSSAFYVDLPEAFSTQGWLALGQPEASLTDVPMSARLIEPKRGRLVLFPSTLWHGTLPFTSGERLSVAFDIA